MASERPIKRATLIQDVSEFRELVGGYWRRAIEPLGLGLMNYDQALLWIIGEELELCYGLFAHGHIHNASPFEAIHNRLAGEMDLSVEFCRHIKAPRVYSDTNQIDLLLRGRDLYIGYYTLAFAFANQTHFYYNG